MHKTLNKNSRERESSPLFKFNKIFMSKISKIIFGFVFVFVLITASFSIVIYEAQASTSPCTITMTLKLTYRGPQVKCLQTNLNIIADGNFGPKTKLAVIAWQKLKGLTADGIFGPKSRAVFVTNVSTAVSGTFATGCTSTSGFSITTGVSCLTGISTTPTTYKAGCTSTTAFSITTGLSCTTIPVTNTTPVFYGGGGGGGGRGSATIYPITAISAITGTVKVGQVLSAGAVTPSGATVSYQWQISTTEDGTYTNISGATSSTYTILASDVTKFIKVLATGTGSYNSTVTSTATTIIAPTAINITAIAGITVPAGGAIPTATIADTTQYTAIILWTGNPITFTGNTEYLLLLLSHQRMVIHLQVSLLIYLPYQEP